MTDADISLYTRTRLYSDSSFGYADLAIARQRIFLLTDGHAHGEGGPVIRDFTRVPQCEIRAMCSKLTLLELLMIQLFGRDQ